MIFPNALDSQTLLPLYSNAMYYKITAFIIVHVHNNLFPEQSLGDKKRTELPL